MIKKIHFQPQISIIFCFKQICNKFYNLYFKSFITLLMTRINSIFIISKVIQNVFEYWVIEFYLSRFHSFEYLFIWNFFPSLTNGYNKLYRIGLSFNLNNRNQIYPKNQLCIVWNAHTVRVIQISSGFM
jgi:hypothetical protein